MYSSVFKQKNKLSDVCKERSCDAAENDVREKRVVLERTPCVTLVPHIEKDTGVEVGEQSDSFVSSIISVRPRDSTLPTSRYLRSRKIRRVSDNDEDSAQSEVSAPLFKIGTPLRGRGRPPTSKYVDLAAAKAAYLKAQREELRFRAEEEVLSLEIETRIKRSALSSVLVSQQGEDKSVDLVGRITASLGVVENVATKLSGISGRCVNETQNAIKELKQDIEELSKHTVSEETRTLRADNERLQKQLEALQNEMKELRTNVKRTPETTQTSSLDELEARVMNNLEAMIDAQIEKLEPRLNPAPNQDRRRTVTEGVAKRPSRIDVAIIPNPSGVLALTAHQTRPQTEPQEAGKKKKSKKGKEKTPVQAAKPTQTPAAASSSTQLRPSSPVPSFTEEVLSKNTQAVRLQQTRTSTIAAKPKLRVPRSAAVVLTLPPDAQEKGLTYAAALREAKNKVQLKDLGIEAVKIRRAATGATIIQIPGVNRDEKADCLASKLKEIYSESDIRVARPIKTAELRVSGLDDSITAEDIRDAIAKTGGCPAEQIKVGEVRQDRSGLNAAWVRCPVLAAKKVSEGRLIVGWASARVVLLQNRDLRCFRCLQSGHVASRCMAEEDRSRLCYRCGAADHRAAGCTAKPNCTLCAVAGKKTNHLLGGKACSALIKKMPKRAPATKKAVTNILPSVWRCPLVHNMTLQLLQANINHCARAQDLLLQNMAQWLINITIVSEPYMVPQSDNWFGDRDELVAIAVSSHEGSPRVITSTRGNGCVAVKFENFVIVGVYFSPNRTFTDFEAFLAEVGSLVEWGRPQNVIVAGDLNAKSSVWGSPVNNARGIAVVEWLTAHNLASLNRGSENTCVQKQGGSIIDVTFASPALARCVSNWRVLTEVETLSDHRYIQCLVDSCQQSPPTSGSQPTREIGPRKLDFNALSLAVEAWCPKPNNISAESEVEWFGESMQHITDAAMPRSRPIPYRKQLYRWSPELAQLRATCLAARRRYTRYRRRRLVTRDSEEEKRYYAEYQAAKSALRIAIVEAKKMACIDCT